MVRDGHADHMKVFEGIETAARGGLRKCVATLGVFDGVHIGHRHVLTETVLYGQERRAPSVVVTFGTHPKGVISGTPPQLITSLRHRLRLFEALGLDAALVLDFDATLRGTSAEDFAARVFADALDCQLVVLGCDTRFGRGGRGDLSLLRDVGKRRGFDAVNADAVVVGGQKVSSTRIRESILKGELGDAARMLGRPVAVLGTVVSGDRRGRTLGWPTANLDLHHEVRPPRGVWGVEVLVDGIRRHGLCNIGFRPTFDAPPQGDPDAWPARDAFDRIEVHLLDFSGDLYGKDLEVRFLCRIRDEMKFPGKDALVARLEADRAWFRRWLAGESFGG